MMQQLDLFDLSIETQLLSMQPGETLQMADLFVTYNGIKPWADGRQRHKWEFKNVEYPAGQIYSGYAWDAGSMARSVMERR